MKNGYKKVLIDFSVKQVMEVPEDWDKNIIEFHYNDSSWCADNLLEQLNKRSEEGRCLCDITEAKYIRDAIKSDEKQCL